jgi:hypothetical protein
MSIKFSGDRRPLCAPRRQYAPLSRLGVCAPFSVTAEHAACIRRAQAASSELLRCAREHTLCSARADSELGGVMVRFKLMGIGLGLLLAVAACDGDPASAVRRESRHG